MQSGMVDDVSKVYEDKPTNGPIEENVGRAVRGGSYTLDRIALSSGRRFLVNSPTIQSEHTGFRPARTYR